MNSIAVDPNSAEPGFPRADRAAERGPQTRGSFFIADAAAAQRALTAVALGYWAVFWIMNGLDKFLNRTDIGWIYWYGKDRSEQFGEYFSRLELAPGAIDGLLAFTGVWEFVVAAPFIAALATLFFRPAFRFAQPFIYWGYFLTGLTLIGFSVFDVIAGDRAELREHGLYLALMFVCCLWSRLQSLTEARQSSEHGLRYK